MYARYSFDKPCLIFVKHLEQVKHLRMWIFECRDPSAQAFKLGLAAAILLILAHAIANLLGGCICIWSRQDFDKATANKQLAVASLISSWYSTTITISSFVPNSIHFPIQQISFHEN